VIALVLSPVVVVWKGAIILLFALVAVLFPWAAALNSNVAAGTRYWSFRSVGITELGPSFTHQTAGKLLGLALIVAAVLGHWLKWPTWWSNLFRDGVLAGPAIAFVLFGAASIYETSIWLVERGAIKRCSNDHDFDLFERSCPHCSAKKELEIVIDNHDSA
jgi:hypothetical protein